MKAVLEKCRQLGLDYYPDPSSMYYARQGFPTAPELKTELVPVLRNFLPWKKYDTQSYNFFDFVRGTYRGVLLTLFASQRRGGKYSTCRVHCLIKTTRTLGKLMIEQFERSNPPCSVQAVESTVLLTFLNLQKVDPSNLRILLDEATRISNSLGT